MRATFILLLLAGGLVHAQGRKRPAAPDPLRDLQAAFRNLESKAPGFMPPKEEQMRILREVARLRSDTGLTWLIGLARDARYLHLHTDLLDLLAAEPGDSGAIAGLMTEHMFPDDPSRRVARDYLLDRATRKSDADWINGLYARGTLEDRFLALEAMGRIGSDATLRTATALMEDREWQPIPGTKVRCGTIARSLRLQEGPEAARLLLLLQRDERFAPTDAEAVREATRLWGRLDLRQYIEIDGLASPDAAVRLDTARFLGMARIEGARAPLLFVARNSAEEPQVRAAAAAALGRLRLARGDLAHELTALLPDPDPRVRSGAVEGLSYLRVRQAAAAVASLLGGPMAEDARAALVRMSGLPEATDWATWLAGCPFPEGT